MYKTLPTKIFDVIIKSFLILFSFYIFNEILAYIRLGSVSKWLSQLNIANLSDNFSTATPKIFGSIAMAIFHEIIFLRWIDRRITDFKIYIGTILKSTNLLYDSMLNTSTIHKSHLDNFINAFFSRSSGKIHLYNPDSEMFSKGSPVVSAVFDRIKDGNIRKLYISCAEDQKTKFQNLTDALSSINKKDALIFNSIVVSKSTPRYAAYYEFHSENKTKYNLAFFMWRSRIAPQKDNIVHILRSNYFIKMANEDQYDLSDELTKLVEAFCKDGFDLVQYSHP
jgi:hypothetical protein